LESRRNNDSRRRGDCARYSRTTGGICVGEGIRVAICVRDATNDNTRAGRSRRWEGLLEESTVLSCILSITLKDICIEEATSLNHSSGRRVGIVSRACGRAASSVEGTGRPKHVI
jgi:hypothetical protein